MSYHIRGENYLRDYESRHIKLKAAFADVAKAAGMTGSVASGMIIAAAVVSGSPLALIGGAALFTGSALLLR